MTLSELRREFPHTDSVTYLNHAATGPLSRRVVSAIEKYVGERHRTNIENYFDFQTVVDRTLDRCATLIGTQSGRLEYASNTASGLNLLADGFDWRPGDHVAVPACEFPANVYPFMNLRDRGVILDFIPHREATFTLEDVEATLTPRTRLLSVSWVQFLSGFRCDLLDLSALCRRRGVMFAVDAIQGLGALQLDADQAGIDFLATSGHKWLMSTHGLGFLFVSECMQEMIRPRAGWLHGPVDWDDFFDYRLEFHPDARRFRLGTLNNLGIAALDAALGLYFESGPTWCEERVVANAARLAELLDETGLRPYGRCGGQAPRSGIVTYAHPEASRLHDHLRREGIITSLRSGLLRISPTYYNTEDELERTAAEVRIFLESRRAHG